MAETDSHEKNGVLAAAEIEDPLGGDELPIPATTIPQMQARSVDEFQFPFSPVRRISQEIPMDWMSPSSLPHPPPLKRVASDLLLVKKPEPASDNFLFMVSLPFLL